jgi:hypothetical protein
MKEVGGRGIMRIFDLHANTARYELKVVLLHLWRVNVKTNSGFETFHSLIYHIYKLEP